MQLYTAVVPPIALNALITIALFSLAIAGMMLGKWWLMTAGIILYFLTGKSP